MIKANDIGGDTYRRLLIWSTDWNDVPVAHRTKGNRSNAKFSDGRPPFRSSTGRSGN
jgi:hypothetical protein